MNSIQSDTAAFTEQSKEQLLAEITRLQEQFSSFKLANTTINATSTSAPSSQDTTASINNTNSSDSVFKPTTQGSSRTSELD